MNKKMKLDSDYSQWLKELKNKIRSVQLKTAIKVNFEMLNFYWELGADIAEKQAVAKWGDGLLTNLSRDLMKEFPEVKGFSKRNLELIRKWYCFWQEKMPNAKQLATQIPWWHNVLIITKVKKPDEALFYVQKTISNSWSRSVLTHHIESDLYAREGKAINNFKATLPKPQSDLAKETIKDPYNFDFLTIREKHDEKELEAALVNHVTKFLLELGAGFSYIGKQYRIEIAGEEFFIDLLFYHVKLHCYVIVELKSQKFKPEYIGKLNFYVSAIDDILRTDKDNPTIGILICKSKNKTIVEYTLKDINKPIGISEYNITKNLPKNFKFSLPSIEEIENELRNKDE
jgi:predicted nuclease of restriction endonuclease-like (RecB) superfamily